MGVYACIETRRKTRSLNSISRLEVFYGRSSRRPVFFYAAGKKPENREPLQCGLRTHVRIGREASMHFLIFCGVVYFLPAIVAAVRHTHNATGILLLNVFLGWTVVGWFVALLMAIFSEPCWAYYYRRGW